MKVRVWQREGKCASLRVSHAEELAVSDSRADPGQRGNVIVHSDTMMSYAT